jgi:hypothetical protein
MFVCTLYWFQRGAFSMEFLSFLLSSIDFSMGLSLFFMGHWFACSYHVHFYTTMNSTWIPYVDSYDTLIFNMWYLCMFWWFIEVLMYVTKVHWFQHRIHMLAKFFRKNTHEYAILGPKVTRLRRSHELFRNLFT